MKGTNDELHTEPRGYCGNHYCSVEGCVQTVSTKGDYCMKHSPHVAPFKSTCSGNCGDCLREYRERDIIPRHFPPPVFSAGPIADPAFERVPCVRVPEINPAMPGPGGAPTRATTLPTDATGRKQYPLATGLFDYFPDALLEIAHVSWLGNEQHNPGQPLHWDRSKSADEDDAMLRHFARRGLKDSDGVRERAKQCWRSLAALQKEIEAEQARERSGE